MWEVEYDLGGKVVDAQLLPALPEIEGYLVDPDYRKIRGRAM